MPETITDNLAKTTKETMTGGKAVVEALKAEGVDTVFGIISIHMLPVYDALRSDPDMRLIVPRHEMAGGFMADAYNRASGKIGVYFTSTGPGAANSMGAVLESWYCNSQTLQITSQIESHLLEQGKCTLHEIKDQVGMFNATGAEAVRAAKTADIVPAIQAAMRKLRSGRPRPQVVEIPIDQQYAKEEIEIAPSPTPELPEASGTQLDEAAQLLAGAERPVIWVGGGLITSGAFEELEQLAEKLGAAIFLTRGGRGAIDEDHPLVLGNYFGERPARTFLEGADAILAIGTKFSWHSTAQYSLSLTPNLIRVDIDDAMLDQNYPAKIGVHSDARSALAGLLDRIDKTGAMPNEDYGQEIGNLKMDLREGFRNFRPLTAELMDRIDKAAPRDRLIVTDSTIPAYWGANQYLPLHERRGFATPRLAAIGAGYPLALGAQAARPDKPVLCIAGDGGFMLHLGELATAVQSKLPVVLVIFNNSGYGVLRMLQRTMMQGREFGCDLHTPDFVKLADSFGIAAERAETPDQLEAAVKRGFDAGAPYLIDVTAPFEG